MFSKNAHLSYASVRACVCVYSVSLCVRVGIKFVWNVLLVLKNGHNKGESLTKFA